MSTSHISNLKCPVCLKLEVTLAPTGEFSCSGCHVAGRASQMSPYHVFSVRTPGGAMARLTARRRELRSRKGQMTAGQLA